MSKQTDIESALAEKLAAREKERSSARYGVEQSPLRDTTGQDLTDPFTGVIFSARSRNHYEFNDGVPVAPPLDLNRPTIRQRIENLLNRDPGILQRYMMEGPPDGSEGTDMEVPDDPDAPLTASEQNFIDMAAAELAEAAPLPDEGLPRLEPQPPTQVPQTASAAPGGGPEAVSTAGVSPPPSAAAAAAPARTVPTR